MNENCVKNNSLCEFYCPYDTAGYNGCMYGASAEDHKVIPPCTQNNDELSQLRAETGASIADIAKALNLCRSYDVAKEYIKLKSTAVARYKVIDGKKLPLDTTDYIKLARENATTNKMRI